jgi:hypothetical protein
MARIEHPHCATCQCSPETPSAVNQCDGCRRGAPLKNGIHYTSNELGALPVMYCQADRYTENGSVTHRRSE